MGQEFFWSDFLTRKPFVILTKRPAEYGFALATGVAKQSEGLPGRHVTVVRVYLCEYAALGRLDTVRYSK